MQAATKKKFLSICVGATLLVIALTQFVSPYMLVATVSYTLLLLGYCVRREDRNLHSGLMGAGIALDLSLVLILEFQRDAIGTAVSLKLSALQQAHIYASSLATALYIPIVIIGFKLLYNKGNRTKLLPWHKRLGTLALIFRTLGFFLMFSLLDKPTG